MTTRCKQLSQDDAIWMQVGMWVCWRLQIQVKVMDINHSLPSTMLIVPFKRRTCRASGVTNFPLSCDGWMEMAPTIIPCPKNPTHERKILVAWDGSVDGWRQVHLDFSRPILSLLLPFVWSFTPYHLFPLVCFKSPPDEDLKNETLSR